MASEEILEVEKDTDTPDPDATYPPDRDVVTQNYDLVVGSLMDQIENSDIILRPSFQRGYVWSNAMASKLIESVMLNVPIPPCYLSQNEDFELDVIDGQQRLESIHRFMDNQFALSSLAIAKEFNGFRFHKLPTKIQRQIKTHTIRCVMITNKSHPDVKFDIFERLNSNTSTLNAQELRNCLYRGDFNDLLKSIASRESWLKILGRKKADKRMRGEETILRYFAIQELGLDTYRTPLKNWLNDAAAAGSKMTPDQIADFDKKWENMLAVASCLFSADECFRRPASKAVNKSLFDLVSHTASRISMEKAIANRSRIRDDYFDILKETDFEDLISRAVDHKRRMQQRFDLWEDKFSWVFK
ncbi:DUF262 domain-containing protein [Epibacterium sp. SM1969]|uniref:DUF262 domain-containing protein n=1 Tax=Tritonibacter aquimaris TaxID=2663379 RepID=A0A844ASX2_9RHOB|nr:DUF262 domain-containing protein [Tritonibacter aquimaris]MQY42847.1 DUF262 domain-containing protein [Tritonibacter aquimaris]